FSCSVLPPRLSLVVSLAVFCLLASHWLFLLQSCGVDFEVKGFCAENLEEKIHKRSSARLIVRKVQYAPEVSGPAPRADTTRQFMMSDRPLQLEASLDKE
ncbi:hypothetical protein FKM82_029184, partial [Ascaphus truei]